MFGPHLVLEGYGCDKTQALACKESLHEALYKLPEIMDMTIIMPPQILDYDGGDIPEDKGISGFVIIAESHIAIHTFPEKKFFTLDIFSCKPFDCEIVLEFVQEIFAPKSTEHQLFDRGREFPRCIDRAGEILSAERASV